MSQNPFGDLRLLLIDPLTLEKDQIAAFKHMKIDQKQLF